MKKKFALLVLTFTMLSAPSVWAASSAYKTFNLTKNWRVTATDGKWLSANKTSASGSFTVYSTAMTMWTNPQARLVNSNKEARSSAVTVKKIKTTYTGSNNTGAKGYTYYMQLKPSKFQSGSDTIKLKFDPK